MSSSSTYLTSSPVPFSPIPGHPVGMSFEPGGWTRLATPLMEMAHQRFRGAAILLTSGFVDRAHVRAQDGLDFEQAYMARARAEHEAGVR